MLHHLDSSAVTEHMQPHPPWEGDAAMALSSAEAVQGYPLPAWDCEIKWSNGLIMYNMFIRSCGSLLADAPSVSFTLVGSSKELGTFPWWSGGLETETQTFNAGLEFR